MFYWIIPFEIPQKPLQQSTTVSCRQIVNGDIQRFLRFVSKKYDVTVK